MSHRISGFYAAMTNENSNLYQYAPLLYGTYPFTVERRIFPADFSLKEILLDAYQLTNNNATEQFCPIFPDGCISLVFPVDNSENKTAYILGPAIFSRKLKIKPSSSVFILRLKPGIADWLDIIPASELLGEVFPLRHYLKNTENFLSKLSHAESFHERTIFATHLFNENDAQSYRRSPLLVHCLHTINSAFGQVKIADLARKLGCCARYLDMMFRRFVGLSTKNYCDVVRFQHTLDSILKQPQLSLLNIATGNGYFDQAHMNRSFKKFTGIASSFFRKPYNNIESKLILHDIQLTDLEV